MSILREQLNHFSDHHQLPLLGFSANWWNLYRKQTVQIEFTKFENPDG